VALLLATVNLSAEMHACVHHVPIIMLPGGCWQCVGLGNPVSLDRRQVQCSFILGLFFIFYTPKMK
jgi:hypothetical protein